LPVVPIVPLVPAVPVVPIVPLVPLVPAPYITNLLGDWTILSPQLAMERWREHSSEELERLEREIRRQEIQRQLEEAELRARERLDAQLRLIIAIREGRVDEIKDLYNRVGDDVQDAMEQLETALLPSETCLMLAARLNKTGVIRKLVKECGADLETRDETGCTALLLAARQGHVEAVKVLLEFGANPNAASWGRFLNREKNALHVAATHGHADVINLLVNEWGFDTEKRSEDGSTAMLWAAWMCRAGAIRALRKLGADVDVQGLDPEEVSDEVLDVVRNNMGWTPLKWVISRAEEIDRRRGEGEALEAVKALFEVPRDYRGRAEKIDALLEGEKTLIRVLAEIIMDFAAEIPDVNRRYKSRKILEDAPTEEIREFLEDFAVETDSTRRDIDPVEWPALPRRRY